MENFPTRKKIRLPRPAYTQGHAFFITVATHDKYPWFHLYPQLTHAAVRIMRDLAAAREISIYAWSIMPDHLHLLLQGHEPVDFIRVFKGKITPLARAIDPRRRLWQRSFFDHALRREESVSRIACYIWENPTRSGISEDPIEYPWSGSEVWPDWREFYSRGGV